MNQGISEWIFLLPGSSGVYDSIVHTNPKKQFYERKREKEGKRKEGRKKGREGGREGTEGGREVACKDRDRDGWSSSDSAEMFILSTTFSWLSTCKLKDAQEYTLLNTAVWVKAAGKIP